MGAVVKDYRFTHDLPASGPRDYFFEIHRDTPALNDRSPGFAPDVVGGLCDAAMSGTDRSDFAAYIASELPAGVVSWYDGLDSTDKDNLWLSVKAETQDIRA